MKVCLPLPSLDALTHSIPLLDKEWGKKTTLPEFLHSNSKALKAEFHGFNDDDKEVLLLEYLEAKEEKDKAAKNLSNISVSKIVNAKMKLIATAVCLLFFLDMTLNSL